MKACPEQRQTAMSQQPTLAIAAFQPHPLRDKSFAHTGQGNDSRSHPRKYQQPRKDVAGESGLKINGQLPAAMMKGCNSLEKSISRWVMKGSRKISEPNMMSILGTKAMVLS